MTHIKTNYVSTHNRARLSSGCNSTTNVDAGETNTKALAIVAQSRHENTSPRFAVACILVAWLIGAFAVNVVNGSEDQPSNSKTSKAADQTVKSSVDSRSFNSAIDRLLTRDAIVTSRIDGLLRMKQNQVIADRLASGIALKEVKTQQPPQTQEVAPIELPEIRELPKLASADSLAVDPVLEMMPFSAWVTKTAYRELDNRFRLNGLHQMTNSRITLDMARSSSLPGLSRLMLTTRIPNASDSSESAKPYVAVAIAQQEAIAKVAAIKSQSEPKIVSAGLAMPTTSSGQIIVPVSGAGGNAAATTNSSNPTPQPQAVASQNEQSQALVATEAEVLDGRVAKTQGTVIQETPRQEPTVADKPAIAEPVRQTPERAALPLVQTQKAKAAPDTRVAARWPLGAVAGAASTQSAVSLNVDNTDVRSVLEMLARGYGMNILVSPEVKGSVSANVDGLSPDQTLQGVLKMCDLRAQVEEDVIYVYPAAKMPDDSRIVRHFPLDFARAEVVEPTIQGLISPIGNAYVNKMESTDNLRTQEAIVVVDTPESVSRIESYIVQVDRPPRQVMIEARVLEVELTDDMKHGVNFSSILGGDLNIGAFGLADRVASNVNPLFFAEFDGTRVQALIDTLETTTDAKTLATPSVMVVNGQNARIQVGQQLGFTVATVTQTSTVQDVQFLETGVVLSVTPTISRDNQIMMQVKPEVSNGQINPDTLLPEEETRELETSVLLNNHQGVVIGGLIQENDRTVIRKLPWLGDVKHIGKLFQRREAVRSRSEIIIALVPHIINLDEHPERDHFDRERWHMDYERTNGPLLYGPLQRVCRPEPRLPDQFGDSNHMDVNRVNQMIP